MALERAVAGELAEEDVEHRRQEEAEAGSRRSCRRTRRRPWRGASPRRRRCEITSGTTPMMNAIDVIRIGRSRRRLAASTAAWNGVRPSSSCSGRIRRSGWRSCRQPDEHDQADLREDIVVAAGEPDAGDGEEQAHRHDQDDGERQRKLSYCAASTRNTSRMASGKTIDAGVAGEDLLIGQLGPFEAEALAAGSPRRCVRLPPPPGRS